MDFSQIPEPERASMLQLIEEKQVHLPYFKILI